MAAIFTRIAVCGGGAMGAGIAQVAAQSGAHVQVYDASGAALEASQARTLGAIETLVARGRMAAEDAARLRENLHWVDTLDSLAGSELVIEAIFEDADAKAALFSRLEAVTAPDTVIATNTSSLPIARLARGLAHPDRFIGMHFFNPATAMKLVEVIPSPATAAAVKARVTATAQAWGKIAIPVADVPGFIVNRVARPYYAEAFTALAEAAASPAQIDALFRAAGFRMGPLELTDLIGQDINFTVARSIHDAYFGRTRFAPQQYQAALVNAGRLGRKTGQGVYAYPAGPEKLSAEPASMQVTLEHEAAADALRVAPGRLVNCQGVSIGMTRGRSARSESRIAGSPVALLDWQPAGVDGAPVAFAVSEESAARTAEAVLLASGQTALRVRDRPGLIVARCLAQIANAAADAVLEQVADEEGIDTALRHGANYPFGPFAWADAVGRSVVLRILEGIADDTGEAMYRPSFYLRSTA